MTVSSWYFGSWESVYFDVLYTDSKLQRFKIIIKPDLSDATLHVINMSEIIADDLMESLAFKICEGYRICEDALVSFWNNHKKWGAYAGLTSAPFANVVSRWNGLGYVDSLCPASGRFVYCTDDGVRGRRRRRVLIVDLL